MTDLKPCPFCGEQIRQAHYGLIHPEGDGECVLAGMTWDAEYYSAAWNRRAAEEIERLEERLAEAYQLAGSIAFDHDISGPHIERLLDLLAGVNLSKGQ